MGLQGAAITRFGSDQPADCGGDRHHDPARGQHRRARLARAVGAATGATRLDALAWLSYIIGAALAMGAQHVTGYPLLLAAAALLAIAVETATEGGAR